MNTTATRKKASSNLPAPRRPKTAPAPPARPSFHVAQGEPRVYSYMRFSSPSQAGGTSVQRQSEYAEKWAAEHGFKLDETLTILDEGLSAYHQNHIKNGGLGVFLKAVENGLVVPGSVLVVESLDRLSRASVDIALAQLMNIVRAGLRVVTASDGREYSSAAIATNPIDLIVSITVMMRANEESVRKSDRIQRALRTRCQEFIAGTWRGRLSSGRDPFWIEWQPKTDRNGDVKWNERDGTFKLNAEGMCALREALTLYYDGYGPTRLFDEMEKRGVKRPHGMGQHNRLYKTFRNRALIGERSFDVMGETFVLTDYYPPVMTVEEFNQLQHMLDGRGRKSVGVKGTIPPLFTGMKICFCGRCNWAMVSQNMASRRRADGTYWDTGRRLFCGGTLGPDGCRENISTSIVPIEHALMEFCSDQMNLDSLRASDNGASTLASSIVKKKAEHAELESEARRLSKELAKGKSKYAGELLRETERTIEELETDIMEMEREYATLSATDISASADTWAALAKGVHALDYDERMRARKLVVNAFSKIAVYISGARGNTPEFVDLELVSRQGVYRYLRIDRVTGAWVQSHDFDALSSLPVGE